VPNVSTFSLSRGRLARWLVAGTLAAGLAMAVPSLASASSTVCRGTPTAPGVLSGSYTGDVFIDGVCAVNNGPANVNGTLILGRNAALIAAFGAKDSVLNVTGNIRVGHGAAMILGCLPSSFACLDDPNPNSPTLSSAPNVGGSIVASDPLGVIVHNATIGGSVRQRGGGGGVSCNPSGIFAAFGSPVYSDYEDSSISGGLSVERLHSCWLGVARVHLGGTARFIGVALADPDGIEIIANVIGGDLVCRGNNQVWDSADLSSTGSLYPRLPEPNTVNGARRGQCELASPKDAGGPLGPGPF
jgi:hypothetical protein